MTTVVVLQPGYLPWLGFFDQMKRADVFVYYDDVQYDKHGWRNRNRVKSPGGPVWLTVPVRHTGLGTQAINEVEIDNRMPWARKHVQTMAQLYTRASHTTSYLPVMKEILERPWRLLVDLDIALTETIRGWLGINCEVHRASDLGIPGGQNDRLLDICLHFGADTYLSGDSARNYLDVPRFERKGIKVEWQRYAHPLYQQLHSEFISHLSVVDLLFNVGCDSGRLLTSETEEASLANHRVS